MHKNVTIGMKAITTTSDYTTLNAEVTITPYPSTIGSTTVDTVTTASLYETITATFQMQIWLLLLLHQVGLLLLH